MKYFYILLISFSLSACGNSQVGIWSSGDSQLLINSDGSAQHVVGEEFFFYSWVPSDKQATKGDYFRLEAVRSGGEMAGVSTTRQPKKVKLYALDGLTFILAIDGRLYLDGKGIYTRAK
jgi:hypothetical protein